MKKKMIKQQKYKQLQLMISNKVFKDQVENQNLIIKFSQIIKEINKLC